MSHHTPTQSLEMAKLLRRSKAYDRLCIWLDSTNRLDAQLLTDLEAIIERPLPAPPPGYFACDSRSEEYPILFKSKHIPNIRAGLKTQTRRLIRPQPLHGLVLHGYEWLPLDDSGVITGDVKSRYRCPYGVPGDRLWVRETWATRDDLHNLVEYKADHQEPCGPPFEHIHDLTTKWRPSIHMPRWASRITLEITEVRFQRLQEISYYDVLEEGLKKQFLTDEQQTDAGHIREAKEAFAQSWDAINRHFPFSVNPKVWAITYRMLKDELL